MWAKYDYSKLPVVIVKFESDIKSEEDINKFLDEWMLLYDNKKNFTFVLDTTNMGIIKLKYCNKIRKFVKSMKELNNQYLEKSLVIVSNKAVNHLINFIFKFQKPISNLYLYNLKKEEELNINNLLDKIEKKNLEGFKVIEN